MAYQMYRNTTLGVTLHETLDELVQVGLECCFQLFGRLLGSKKFESDHT